MLQTKRRNFKRFEGALFIEFRPLTGIASYALGLTKNFSWEGFSIEYQDFSLEPGDRLEFKLRQPGTNQFIGFMGNVIWKQQNDIKCSAGVKFKNIDREFKESMMEMIADSCNISTESWRQNNKRLSHIKISNNPISELDQTDETEYIPELPGKGRLKKTIFKMAVITATGIMLSFIPRMLGNSEEGTLRPVDEFIQSSAEQGAHNKLSSTYQKEHNTTVEEFTQSWPSNPAEIEKAGDDGEGNPVLLEQEKAEDLNLPVRVTDITENSGYYVQVASFKNPEVAFDFFQEITDQYPEAYLFRQDNYYKIRIPDIAAYAQGVILLREIEEKFNIHSNLVQKTQ